MRWNFGVLYPDRWVAAQTGSDRSYFTMQVIATASADVVLEADVRFLQLDDRDIGHERVIPLDGPGRRSFAFGEVQGEIELSSAALDSGTRRVTLTVRNTAPLVEPVLPRSLVSAHAVVGIAGGAFVSMTDPPEHLRTAVEGCCNQGVWPVLAGDPATRDTMLASPIILEDYPRVAPESADDLFDATEIDEILTLRVLTLADGEKAEIRAGGGEGARLLDRAESLAPEHLMRLHGVIREFRPVFRKGDRVRLKPARSADAFDLVLAGKTAIVESVERDYEDNVHLAVVLEDDPGRDLGELRQPGHRFFFSPAEVEPL
jgi:hypothetical protein